MTKTQDKTELKKVINQLVAKTRRQTINKFWRDLQKLNARKDGTLFVYPYSLDILKEKWHIK